MEQSALFMLNIIMINDLTDLVIQIRLQRHERSADHGHRPIGGRARTTAGRRTETDGACRRGTGSVLI